jgi:hypothetical protein
MTLEQARTNLGAAVSHFRLALQLQTNHLGAQIGLAWCLDQQGERAEARRAYERALNLAWENEKGQDDILEISYVQEIIGYLKPLVDPVRDAQELTRLQTYSDAISHKGRAITPIFFALDLGRSFGELVDPKAGVAFDLDGSGLPRRWGWISPRAAWLVFDPQRRGQITSGLQLFGNVTFWVFWKNGYEALSSLDDNHDGMLTGAELEGLAAWQDVNGNGVSDPGEVTPLRALGVEGLSTDGYTNADGLLYNRHGLWLRDGSSRPTFDWVTRCHEQRGR